MIVRVYDALIQFLLFELPDAQITYGEMGQQYDSQCNGLGLARFFIKRVNALLRLEK